MEMWGITHRGMHRQNNQDAYRMEQMGPDATLAVVCDGMGGARAGDVASTLAAETFFMVTHEWGEAQWREDPEAMLHIASHRAHQAVSELSRSRPEFQGMGTTLTAALVIGSQAYLLNVGDSRAYLVGANGAQRLTRDHSVVEVLVHNGKISPEEAKTHPQRNIITRALGIEGPLREDMYRRTLAAGECLLLCSDGLSNVVSEEEMVREIIGNPQRETACKRLLDLALENDAPDNVTAVILQL